MKSAGGTGSKHMGGGMPPAGEGVERKVGSTSPRSLPYARIVCFPHIQGLAFRSPMPVYFEPAAPAEFWATTYPRLSRSALLSPHFCAPLSAGNGCFPGVVWH